MKREINIISAKSYLNIISVRSKDKKHTEHITNALDQIIFLEDWRNKAIKLINSKEKILIDRAKKIEQLNSENLRIENELQKCKEELDNRKKEVETMLEQIELEF